MPELSDFVIIGAGVYGAASAWHLASKGASVTVLDEREIATRASGGPGRRGVRANGRDIRELALMERAYALWPTLHERLEAKPFYERCGHLLLAESDAQRRGMQARAWMQQAQGVETELLSGDAARAREPGLSQDVNAALYCPADGVANHSATTLAYAAAATKLGVRFYTSTQAQSLEVSHDAAQAVITADGQRFAARRGILVLANPGVRALIEPWQSLPIWDECLQVLVSAPLTTVPFRHLTGHIGRTVSLKTEGTDRVMISGGWHGLWDPVTSEGSAQQAAIDGNVHEAVTVYPALKGLRVAVADTSHLETFTPDNIPIIDQLPAAANVWYATGWCGHGWAIAPVIAQDLTTWILDGSKPASIAPFSLARFFR